MALTPRPLYLPIPVLGALFDQLDLGRGQVEQGVDPVVEFGFQADDLGGMLPVLRQALALGLGRVFLKITPQWVIRRDILRYGRAKSRHVGQEQGSPEGDPEGKLRLFLHFRKVRLL